MKAKVLIFIFLSLFSLQIFSADLPLTVRAEVDKAVATTSDDIIYSIVVDHKKEIPNVDIPEAGANVAGFRIIDFGTDLPKEEDGRIIQRRWYKLRADISGSYVLPSLEFSYLDSNGQKQTAKTSEIFVEVKSPQGSTVTDSAKGEKEKDIRDIKAIEKLPWPKSWWFILSGIIGLIVVAGAFWFYQNRKKKVEVLYVKKPHELALEQINTLKNCDWLDRKEDKKFHFALSELIRAYIEGQFNLPATDRTTEELLPELNKNFNSEQAQTLIRLLQKSDLVKFTDTCLQKAESLTLLEQCELFVLQTKPVDIVQEEQSEVTEESVI